MKILIRDNTNGRVFEYGSDHHHALRISGDGSCLTFYNLRNGDGSSGGGYSFVLEDGKTPDESNSQDAIYGECYANIGGFGDVEQEKPLEITPEQFEAIYNDTEDEDDGI